MQIVNATEGSLLPGKQAAGERSVDLPTDKNLQLWGGLECSHVTIDGEVRDQLRETGHVTRDDDLDRIAELGIRTLRYPYLWAHAEGESATSFQFHARRFARLAKLGIEPIVGFLHHGIGPGGLHPTDEGFVTRLADFAEGVVRRYPGLKQFTPINEPVTTARIACLYGQWEPHARDTPTFLRHVAASATATAVVMRRIRAIEPEAKLIQTEDVGRIFATDALAAQARYENERRFLGFDLLCGRVDRDHVFWDELCDAGVDPAELDALVAEPCPPDVIGIDHYLTSDRFLDHRLELYPHEPVGSNGRSEYVDVAAVHIRDLEPKLGVLARMREVHARYGLPIAITEVHNGCTREEQLRWLMEAWNAGLAARSEGIDLRAVTIWSLFGGYDWNTLMGERRGFYESGAFDVRHSPPRPTAIAAAAKALVRDGAFDHPLLARTGWWREDVTGGGAPLHVKGQAEALDTALACCARRRICTITGEAAGLRTWGVLAVDETALGLSITFKAAKATAGLELLAHPGADVLAAIDAALDLAIDGFTGRHRLSELGPHCQYMLEPLPDTEEWADGQRKPRRAAG